MASMTILKGPNAGTRFSIESRETLIGRQPDADIYLEALAVSRQHAKVIHQDGRFTIEDVGSSNGTFVNGERIRGARNLSENDQLQIGPYILGIQVHEEGKEDGATGVIRASINVTGFFSPVAPGDPSRKLQIVLEIGRQLAATFDRQILSDTFLEQIFRLFPQADRGILLLMKGEELFLQAHRNRIAGKENDTRFSKSIARQALEEGVGLLSEDIQDDSRILNSMTFQSLQLRSFLCVPLLGPQNRRLGIVQLDCTRPGNVFSRDDLELLSALCLQGALALENALLHEEQVRQARLHHDLLMAREVQRAFLPADFSALGNSQFEIHARMEPAREVSGDLYDCFRLPDGRLAFFLGDVSGKGMPAALFMFAVRTLIRHIMPSSTGPADLLRKLNDALVADNPTSLFVTLAHGVLDPATGTVILSSGGHPPPLIRRKEGKVERVEVERSMFLGSPVLSPSFKDVTILLEPGETLILYTDGFTEAMAPNGRTLFGEHRLAQLLGGNRTQLPLDQCALEVSRGLLDYTKQADLQDDQTLFLLRRS